jgi:hypothetical protein
MYLENQGCFFLVILGLLRFLLKSVSQPYFGKPNLDLKTLVKEGKEWRR